MEQNLRSGLTVFVDSNLASDFKIWCVSNGIYQNKVIEALIKDFLTKSKEEQKNIINKV